MDTHAKLLENQFYHIYNRGNNRENIFYESGNYNYFLKKYDYYLNDYLETFAYCLLPNHFHLLVRVKPYALFPLATKQIEYDSRTSEQFRLLFMSYAKAINIQEDRVGSLFQKNFKRKHVDNEAYLTRLIHYIHANPKTHCIDDNFKEYPHSSYGRLLIDKPSKLFKKEVIQWLGSKQEYVAFHERSQSSNDISEFIIED